MSARAAKSGLGRRREVLSGWAASVRRLHTYIHTRPMNGCSATLINWPHPGINALGQLTRQASALTRDAWARVIPYGEP